MQTTAPTTSASGAHVSPTRPIATKIVHVRINVAIVIPEIGLEELPIRPVMRADTVTKKKPKRIVKIAARKLPCVGSFGATSRNTKSSAVPPRTTDIGRSRSVRSTDAVPPRPKSFTPSRNDDRMRGSVRASVMMPEASTAPAPM